MPTKIELTLEQSQQGVSYDVLVALKGLKNEKEIVLRIFLENLPEHPSDTKVFTMKMEILLEPTSNKLLVGEEYGFDSKEDEVVLKVYDVSLVDGVFDGAFSEDRDDDLEIREGVVVSSSSGVKYIKFSRWNDDKFVRDPNKTPDSSQRPLIIVPSVETRLMVDNSSNDNTNVVNAPQEPFVFNQDLGENSSQSPPHIDHHCCYGCGDSLDGIFCQRCTCGNGAHIGYNRPSKVSIISNPEPCYNQNVDEFSQTLPSFHPTCYSGDENSFAYDSTPNFVDDSLNVFNPPSQPPMDSYEFCGNDAHYSHDCSPQVLFIYNPKPCYNQDFNIHKIFKVFNNNIFVIPAVGARMRHFNFLVIHQPPQATSIEILHDHENVINSVQTFLWKFNLYSFFETPKVLLLAWDRVSKIKYVFGNKQYKPEDIHELIRKLFNDVQNIHEELAEYINTPSWNCPAFYNYDDDDDEDYTIAITHVLSTEEPVDSLIMADEHLDTIPAMESNEVIKSSVEDLVPIPGESEGIPDNMCDVPFRDNFPPLDISKDQFEDFSNSNDDSTSIDDDYFSIEDIDYIEASPSDSELVSLEEVKDYILREKFLNIHLLIAKIESLNDNLTSDRVLKSPSPFPIPVEDSDSFFEKFDTSLSYSDNSLPKFETFSNHTEETSSGSTTTHADNSLPDDETLLLFSSENEDQVFNPNILSSNPLSHQGKITSNFSENPMMIFGGVIPSLEVPFLHFYPP
nr:hypothetical protein [Tanacetum cinerariifolium]